MCACSFCPTCPGCWPCGTGPCRFDCPVPPPCYPPRCPPPTPCTPCPPCNCCPVYRPCPAPVAPDVVPPVVPMLPACKPRRCPPCEPPPYCPPQPVCYPPVLPCCPPPEPCDPPPCPAVPEPTRCYQPVLPCCNPQCPPPIIPTQRPICPRAPPCPYPCLPVARSCCPDCELDPVTRRRPLVVHDSVYQTRPSGLPGKCFERTNPAVRYSTNSNYAKPAAAPLKRRGAEMCRTDQSACETSRAKRSCVDVVRADWSDRNISAPLRFNEASALAPLLAESW